MADKVVPTSAPRPEKPFNESAQGKGKEEPKQVQGVDSEQVKTQKLGMQGGPKPPGSTRQAVDAQAHKEQMNKDDQQVKKLHEERLQRIEKFNKLAKEKQNQAQLKNDKDNDRGR